MIERDLRLGRRYIDPEKAVASKEEGNAKFREGKFAESIPHYEEAMKRDPKNPAYPNNLAAALTKLGNFAAAKQACEKALDLDPKYVKAIAKKGDLEMLMKEYHKAIESYVFPRGVVPKTNRGDAAAGGRGGSAETRRGDGAELPLMMNRGRKESTETPRRRRGRWRSAAARPAPLAGTRRAWRSSRRTPRASRVW